MNANKNKMGDLEYIEEFIEKYFSSIKEYKKTYFKSLLKGIYKIEKHKLIFFMQELEERINNGGLLVPLGLLNLLEEKFPITLIQVNKKIDKNGCY